MKSIKLRGSIFVKFLAAVLLLYLVQAVAVFFTFMHSFQRDFDTTRQRELRTAASALAAMLQQDFQKELDFSLLEERLSVLQYLLPRSQILLLNDEGKTLHAFFGSNVPLGTVVDISAVQAFVEGAALPIRISHPTETRNRVAFVASRLELAGQQFFLLIVFPNQELFHLLSTQIRNVARSGVFSLSSVLLLTSILVAALVSLVLTSRIRALVITVRNYGAGETASRAPLRGSDEIAELAMAFNVMADEIEARVDDVAKRDALRRELVAALSHDLGAPSGAILNACETLFERDKELSSEQRAEYLESVFRNAQSLRILTTDLIDIARLGSLSLSVAPSEVSVNEVLRDLYAMSQPLAEPAEVELQLNTAADELYIECDPVILERILFNLISNAIRHTPAGGEVVLSVARVGERAEFKVRDTGSGISAEEQGLIFERFYQGSGGNLGLSGLGLSIVRTLLQSMGSDIALESSPGKGSCFSFSFPILADE